MQIIGDDVKHYAFSNCFEIASKSKPYEKVVFGQNQIYVLETIRAEGTSPWYTCAHDEFALSMDGEVDIHLVKLDAEQTTCPTPSTTAPCLVKGEPKGAADGLDAHHARPPGDAAEEQRLPVPQREARGADPADLQGRSQRRALGRDLPDRLERTAPATPETHTMNAPAELAKVLASSPDATHGYKSFTLGAASRSGATSTSRTSPGKQRDGRTLSHTMDAGNFLRAMMRDVAWGFFYGWVNFDHMHGAPSTSTPRSDLYAGSYNATMKEAGVDLLENFPTEQIRATFEQMLDDWTNQSFDPFSAPQETGTPYGRKNGNNTKKITRERELRQAALRRHEGRPASAQRRARRADQPRFRRRAAERAGAPPRAGLRERGACFQPCSASCEPVAGDLESDLHLGREVQTMCPTTEEHILPIIHGNDRVEWFFQMCDEIDWNCADKNTGKPLARVIMKGGRRVAAMPAYCRHQGYSPKRSMLLVWENGSPTLVYEIEKGESPEVPVRF